MTAAMSGVIAFLRDGLLCTTVATGPSTSTRTGGSVDARGWDTGLPGGVAAGRCSEGRSGTDQQELGGGAVVEPEPTGAAAPVVEEPEVEQLALLEVERDVAAEVAAQPLDTPEPDLAVEQARSDAAPPSGSARSRPGSPWPRRAGRPRPPTPSVRPARPQPPRRPRWSGPGRACRPPRRPSRSRRGVRTRSGASSSTAGTSRIGPPSWTTAATTVRA